MCSRLRQDGATYQPGDNVLVFVPECGADYFKWTGFARSERLGEWLKVWELVEIPVDGFAERNHATGANVWTDGDAIVAGVLFRDQVRIITREARLSERDFFGHSRHPVLVEESDG